MKLNPLTHSLKLAPISVAIGISMLGILWVGIWDLDSAFAQTRRRTVSGERGGSFSTTRQVQGNGDGTFSQSGTFTTTTPSGRSRSGSFSGSGQSSRTPGEGINTTSTTDITTSGGRSLSLDRDRNTTYVPGEGVQQTRSTTLRNGDGEVLGTSSGSASLNSSGLESNTTFTGRRGRSGTVDSTVTRESQGLFRRSTTVSNDEGEILGGADTTIEVDGEPGQGWTQQITGTTRSGRSIDRTVVNEPVEEGL